MLEVAGRLAAMAAVLFLAAMPGSAAAVAAAPNAAPSATPNSRQPAAPLPPTSKTAVNPSVAQPYSDAALTVQDDSGHAIVLAHPARRIVSLAPHATELLFAAGAGNAVVGVTDYSDYPAAARTIPGLGSSAGFDLERIAAMKPDLIVAWGSGNPAAKLATLRRMGFVVFESEPRQFETIATSLERLAHLSGTDKVGADAAQAFRARLAALRASHQDLPTVSVFYQIWRAPLMTLNGAHLVSQAITLCGGVNIFAALAPLAPTVSIESVVNANPDAIVTSADGHADALAEWRRYGAMKAVRENHLYTLPPDAMSRPGPRVLDGTKALCRQLTRARAAPQ
ncbi:MAG: cobalamin-binding protein [Janthinobacterium lividum]